LSAPALADDRVIVGSSARRFYALDAGSGGLAWQWRVGGTGIGAASDAQSIYLVGLDNILRGLNRRNGNQRWKRAVGSRPAHPPQVFGDLVVVTSVSPTVSVYAAATGALVGTYVAPGEIEGAVLLGPPSDASDPVMVVVLRDGRVVGLTPKAEETPAQKSPPAPPAGTPPPSMPTVPSLPGFPPGS
jgi:outer membrane protein assembly factor BamB